ncbi:MAG: SDR family oxidoreductase [Cyanobacteria bacterium P01_A01_bin.114]
MPNFKTKPTSTNFLERYQIKQIICNPIQEIDEWLKANYHQLPVGLLEPEDIAGTVVFLASPAAQHITGVTVDITAGANARYTA